MSTAWQSYRQRAAAVREIARHVEMSRDGRLPWDTVTAEMFVDQGDLLRELHQMWSRRLSARVDLALDSADGSATESVRAAWRNLADEQPGLRRLLDSHDGHPALRHAVRTERRLLAVAAGLAALDDPPWVAAAAGARLTESISAAA